MSSPSVTPFETILKLCKQASPNPWYPAEFAASLGIDDGRFRGPLQELTDAGLIEPAKWHAERGQGYRLTRDGAAIVDSPGLLEELRLNRGGAREAEPRAARPDLSTAKRPYVTYAILAVNVGMLLLAASIALGGNWGQGGIRWFLIGGNPHARHVTGEASAADIDAGQWWRLLATIFVHRDFFHLLINMSTFIAVSRFAEQLWGCWRLAVIYLVSGLAYACVSLWHEPGTPPLGAAGSIFGTMMSVAAWLALNRRALPRETVSRGMRQVLGSAAWFLAWLVVFAWLGGLEFRWVGYAGGALAGLTTGILLHRQQSMTSPVRWLFLLLVPLVPLASVSLVLQAKGKKPAWRAAVAGERKKNDLVVFNEEIMPAMRKAEVFIKKQWEQIGAICDEDDDKRDKDELAKARQTVAEATKATDDALAVIAAAGKFDADLVAETTAIAKRYLEEQKKLLEMADRGLKGGPGWTERDKKALEDQEDQTKRSWRIFDKKLSPK